MSKIICRRLYDSDIITSITKIQQESANMKKVIFTSSLKNEDTSREKIDKYLNIVNSFLKDWDDYAFSLLDKIKDSHGSEDVFAMRYEWIKDMIYASYDYASILPFTDGVIALCGEENKKVDLEDFMKHTVSKAYKTLPLSTAELLESVLTSENKAGINSFGKSDKLEVKYFDSIRSYKMFKQTDRTELYKAVSHTINFLSLDSNIIKYLKKDDIKLFISAINVIIDYIVYSLSVFACRVYYISSYAYPYIESSGTNRPQVISFSEAVKTGELTSSDHTKPTPIDMFANIDNGRYVNIENACEFFNKFANYLNDYTGSSFKLNEYNGNYVSYIGDDINKNVFVKAVFANPIFNHFRNKGYYDIYSDNASRIIDEELQIMKELLLNMNHANSITSTAKQELLYNIKMVDSSSISLDECKSMMSHLYVFSAFMVSSIESRMRNLNTYRLGVTEQRSTQTSIAGAAELLKLLSEFYKELIGVIIAKARDIEASINQKRSSELDKVFSTLKLDIHDKTNTNDIMANAIPNTMRMPIDMIDIYSKPTFESFDLYDEYVKHTLDVSNDIYFSESFKINDLINKISSIITAAYKRIASFFNNQTVKAAVNWVKSHENDLLTMDFNGVTMDVVPYKINVELHPKFSNLQKGIKNFNEKNCESPEAIKEFIKGLYPSETIYTWFSTKDEKGVSTGSNKYHNYMLFYDENQTTENVPQKVSISGDVIKKNVSEWVKTVTTSDQIISSYKNIGDDINSSINTMKTKLVSISNEASKNGTDASGAPTSLNNVSVDGDNKDSNSTNNKPTNENKTDNQSTEAQVGNDMNMIVTNVNTVVNDIYVSLNGIFIEYIKAMYGYLREAYVKGRNNKTQ